MPFSLLVDFLEEDFSFKSSISESVISSLFAFQTYMYILTYITYFFYIFLFKLYIAKLRTIKTKYTI